MRIISGGLRAKAVFLGTAVLVLVLAGSLRAATDMSRDTLAPSLRISSSLLRENFQKRADEFFGDNSRNFSQKVEISNVLGVHARPSGAIAAGIAQQFPDDKITFIKDGEEADAKDILDLLTLGVQKGDTLTVRVEGPNAAIAGRQIVDFLNELPFFDGEQDLAFTLAKAPEDPVVVGTKALNLIKMRKEGIPVPPGFIVIADRDFTPQTLKSYLKRKLKDLTESFPEDRKMIVSVRSSPMRSAPGLLETILNVGIDTEFVGEMEAQGINGWKMYYEYLKEFGTIALHIDKRKFRIKEKNISDQERAIRFAQIIKEEMKARGQEIQGGTGDIFPMDFIDQLVYAILAIKHSRHRPEIGMMLKAQGRRSRELPTAVIVQSMVFGNRDQDSGSFTLSTVDEHAQGDGIRIEYAQGLQGKAIVGGRISALSLEKSGLGKRQDERIRHIVRKLQEIFGPYLQVEGVVENGDVFITQCRTNNGGQKIIARKNVTMDKSTLLANTIYAAHPEETVNGFAVKISRIGQIDQFPEGGGPYILLFKYADAQSVQMLYKAVLSRKLNIRGVLSGVGGSQTHFARQVELLNELGYDIPYMSDVNYDNISDYSYLSMTPDTYTVKVKQRPYVQQMPLFFESLYESNDVPTLIKQSI